MVSTNNKRLGDFIHLTKELNGDNLVTELLGLSIDKEYIPSVANITGIDLSKYKVIRKNQFSCNVMHVGRDDSFVVALYKNDSLAIISPAYKIFEVNDQNELLSDYLMMMFQRSEFDRYCSYLCDSSIRAGLEWNRFCDIPLVAPNIQTQRKHVLAWINLRKLRRSYINSLSRLESLANTSIDSLTNKIQKQKIGPHIRQIDRRNRDLSVKNRLGISISKKFIESKAAQGSNNLSECKIVESGQFAYVPVTSRNGEKVSIALLDSERGVVSSTYIVFEIGDGARLLPEFLLLWFRRPEFDRYTRFHSWGSARETFDWNDMCKVELPIPDILTQKSIVAIYNALEARKELSERLKATIQKIAPILIRGAEQETATDTQ